MKCLILLCLLITLQNDERVLTISDLFDNPQEFIGKTVQVKGYYANEFENNALYPSARATTNSYRSIWIEEKESTLFINSSGGKIKPYAVNGATVIVTGKFYFHWGGDTIGGRLSGGFGHLNFWRAQLSDVSMIKLELDSVPPLEKLPKH